MYILILVKSENFFTYNLIRQSAHTIQPLLIIFRCQSLLSFCQLIINPIIDILGEVDHVHVKV